MHVGKKIRAWRDERGLTQVQLAEKSNISRSYLAGVETGKYNPSLETLNVIASALGLTASFLLDSGGESSGITASIYIEDSDNEVDARIMDRWEQLTEQEKQLFLAQIDAVLKLRGQ